MRPIKCPNCSIELFVNRNIQSCSECEFRAGITDFKIDSLYAYLLEDSEGNEGIISLCGLGDPIRMIFEDKRSLEGFSKTVRAGNIHGMKIQLVKFSKKEVLEVIQ